MRLSSLPTLRHLRALNVALALAACAGPPPSAYVTSTTRSDTPGIPLARNAAKEACTLQRGTTGGDVFCSTWDQPSGHIVAQPASSTSLATLATTSPWRNVLDNRFDCAAPTPTTILGSTPAYLLNCTRKVGGWPQIALVATIDDRTYLADGILPALQPIESAIGVLSGRVSSQQAATPLPPGQADALLASRLAAQSFGASDIGQFQSLMVAATRANLAENFATAERAYRAAYALQQKALGANDPSTAGPLTLIALQLSNQGRTAEADAAFSQAGRLLARSSDPAARARLDHYQALNRLNEGKPAEALPLDGTARLTRLRRRPRRRGSQDEAGDEREEGRAKQHGMHQRNGGA